MTEPRLTVIRGGRSQGSKRQEHGDRRPAIEGSIAVMLRCEAPARPDGEVQVIPILEGWARVMGRRAEAMRQV